MRPVRILVAGHDSGGLNLLAPLLRSWRKNPRLESEFLGTPVVRRDIAHHVPGIIFAPGVDELSDWLSHRPSELDRFLDAVLAKGHYDALVCGTSAHAMLERRLFLAARRASVPCVAFCDMWWAYIDRFHDGDTWTLPDRLWVIDDAMRAAAKEAAWPCALPIDVVGSPLFGDLARRRAGRGTGRGRALRFISEPASIKYPQARIDEFALADMLVTAFRAGGFDAPVVVRPHPADSQEAWRRWTFSRREESVALDTLPLEEAIADTAFAVGISSIMLVEMRMCGVPTASLQPADADREYYCLPFEDFGIARVADGVALTQWVANPGENAPPPAAAIHMCAIETATQLLFELLSPARRSEVA